LSTLPAIATNTLLPEATAVHPLLRFRFIDILVAAQPTGVGVVGVGAVGVGAVGVGAVGVGVVGVGVVGVGVVGVGDVGVGDVGVGAVGVGDGVGVVGCDVQELPTNTQVLIPPFNCAE